MPILEARLKETTESIDNLLKAIQMGVITKSTKERLEELEAEKNEIESKIALELLIESSFYSDSSILDDCVEIEKLLIASINTAKANMKLK